jgi:flagellar hook protein FlgE
MSLNNTMLAGITGLVANSDALSVISNNIANVNTVGYKTSNADFESLVTDQAPSGAPSSGGVIEQTRQLVTQPGTTTPTSSPTDLSISGQGFFVTSSQPQGISGTNPSAFTRAGSFTENSQGYLQNSAGLYLQGWAADANGVVSPSATNLGALSPINVTALSSAPQLTTQVGINGNLQSSQAVSPAAAAAALSPPGVGAYSATSTTDSMAAYNPTTGVGVPPDFTIQVPISDSEGGQRTVQLDFLKSSTPNQWYAEVVSVPPGDVTNATGVPGQIASGIVAFTPSGALDPNATTLFGGPPMPASPTLTFGASNGPAPTGNAVNWASSLGINGQSVTIDLNAAGGGLTQDDSASATKSISTNGTPFGSLSSVQISPAGDVTALFSNGVSRTIAQVAVATFPNPDGLTNISGDAYNVSQASGAFTLNAAGNGGAGLLAPQTLEASTVDLSTQFAHLITTQQAYSASSKIITTADQMMQVLINVIQ